MRGGTGRTSLNGPRTPPLLLAVLFPLVVLATGCEDDLKEGYCRIDRDCPTGQFCSQEQSANRWHRCFAGDAGSAAADAPSSPDAGGEVGGEADAGTEAGPDHDGAVADLSGSEVSIDAVPEVPAFACTRDTECVEPGLPACDPVTRKCAACVSNAHCTGTRPVCDPVAKVCVGCLARTDCPAATPACDPTTRTCFECLARTDCPAARPACDTAVRMCVGCLANTDCRAPLSVCESATKSCVGCVARSDCGGVTPACDTSVKTCVGCLANSDCAAPTPVCSTAGKVCVGCVTRADCTGNRPACDPTVRACVGCLANSDCSGTTPVCDVAAKSCVQCLTSAQCGGSTPICEGQVCRACRADTECVAKSTIDPGVCMTHQDGRCASDAETIYVQNSPGCAATAATGGTVAAPFCRSQLALDAVTSARRLVVMRGAPALFPFAALTAGPQITVVGQSGATIAPGADIGIRVAAANVYVRNLRVAGGSSMGIFADTGATLTLNRVTVDANVGGGILIDGAAFSITNATVTNNGAGDAMGTTWGGLRVQGASTATPRNLTSVTVQANRGPGISCVAPIQGTGVLAAGNSASDISPACGIIGCGTAGPNCGAPPP